MDNIFKYFWVFWILSAILSISFLGVVIWGIIELVQWVTSL